MSQVSSMNCNIWLTCSC